MLSIRHRMGLIDFALCSCAAFVCCLLCWLCAGPCMCERERLRDICKCETLFLSQGKMTPEWAVICPLLLQNCSVLWVLMGCCFSPDPPFESHHFPNLLFSRARGDAMLPPSLHYSWCEQLFIPSFRCVHEALLQLFSSSHQIYDCGPSPRLGTGSIKCIQNDISLTALLTSLRSLAKLNFDEWWQVAS